MQPVDWRLLARDVQLLFNSKSTLTRYFTLCATLEILFRHAKCIDKTTFSNIPFLDEWPAGWHFHTVDTANCHVYTNQLPHDVSEKILTLPPCIVTSIIFGLKRHYLLVAFPHCKPHKTLFQPTVVHQWFFVSKIKYNFENNYILSISQHTVCTNNRRAEFSHVNHLHFAFQMPSFQCGIISSFPCRKDVTQHALLKNQLYFWKIF